MNGRRACFQVGMPDAFDTMYNKADACGSTGGELGSVSLPQLLQGITGASCRSEFSAWVLLWLVVLSLLPSGYCRACEGDGAFILLVYFVFFPLFLAASPPVFPLPSPALPCPAVLAGR